MTACGPSQTCFQVSCCGSIPRAAVHRGNRVLAPGILRLSAPHVGVCLVSLLPRHGQSAGSPWFKGTKLVHLEITCDGNEVPPAEW